MTELRPLVDTRVVDVTSSLAGPTATQLLAALGADVVKVEPLAGDHARAWGPPFLGDEGAMFLAANAGKRSLALDLTDARGREILLRLADGADVFIQSLRPGAAERHGLGATELRARNPRLIHCSIGAFGTNGPLSDRPGYDPLLQAASGIMSVTGEGDGPPVRVGLSLIDLGTGVWAALGVLAAIYERERTGEGRTLELSLYETALSLLSTQLVGYLGAGVVPGRDGSAFPQIAPYQVFATRDGELMIVAGNDKLFAAFCDVLGAPELVVDPRFVTNPDRVANRASRSSRSGRGSGRPKNCSRHSSQRACRRRRCTTSARRPGSRRPKRSESCSNSATSSPSPRHSPQTASACATTLRRPRSARTPARSSGSSATPRTRSPVLPERASCGSADGTTATRPRLRRRRSPPSPSSPRARARPASRGSSSRA